jgi:hypothetical protein
MSDTSTDCRDEVGITVGLIDAIISISRILAPRIKDMKKTHAAIEESLADLRGDEDLNFIVNGAIQDSSHCTNTHQM